MLTTREEKPSLHMLWLAESLIFVTDHYHSISQHLQLVLVTICEMQTILFPISKNFRTNKQSESLACHDHVTHSQPLSDEDSDTCEAAFIGHHHCPEPYSLVHSLNDQLELHWIPTTGPVIIMAEVIPWTRTTQNQISSVLCADLWNTIDNQIVLSFSLCRMICYFIILLYFRMVQERFL